MPIPAGVICGFTGRAVDVPAGWSRVVALDARHTRGADVGFDAGGTGGSASHVHDGTHDHGATSAHTHSVPGGTGPGTVVNIFNSGAATVTATTNHNHVMGAGASGSSSDVGNSIAIPSWSSVTIDPPWYGVIWIQSDGTPEHIPLGGLVWWNNGTPPTNFTRHVLSGGRYLKGAVGGANAGSTGGVAGAHTHQVFGHYHITAGHTHTLGAGNTSGPSATVAQFTTSSPATLATTATHTHPYVTTSQSSTIQGNSNSDTITSGSTTYEPPFIIMLAITPTVADAPIGIICLWLNTVGSIPGGWVLCNGIGGTPDLRSQFVKASSTGTDIGTTGGTLGHSHTQTTTHGHTSTEHNHIFDVGNDTTTPPPTSITVDGGGSPGAAHFHGHSGVGSTVVIGHADFTDFPLTIEPVAATADTRPRFTDVLYIQLAQILDVTITAPTPDQVETTPTPTVAWTIQAGHTQAKYLVNIYTSDLATRVYSSGVVTSAVSSMSVPSGNVHNGHSYKVYVTLWDTGDVSGTAGPVAFSEVYTEPPGTTLTAVAVPTGLPPYIQLTWPAPSVPGGDVFVQWNILRRVFGSVDWVTIATSTNQALRGYNDYTAAPGTEYEYAVTFTDTRGGDPVTSPPQDPPPSATLIFLGSWIHVVSDPSIYLGYRSNGIKWVPTQDQVGRFAWGRARPTWHIGSQHWKSGQLTEAADFFPVYGGPQVSTSQMVDKFLDAQAGGAVLCYRFGQTDERYFVIIDASQQNTSRTDDLAMSEQDIMINECFFDESALHV